MRIFLLLLALCSLGLHGHSQCSSSLNTPEFPIATHPSDGHTQSWGTNIFTPAQFGAAKTITGIQVYVDNSFGPTTYASQQIWMRHTAVSSYPGASYPTTTGFTQVYTGTYNFPMSGLVTLPFNVSSFAYNGSSNVEILFENRSNVYRVNEPWFRRTASYGATTYRSMWNGNFGFGGFPGSGSNGSAVRLTYTLSITAVGGGGCGSILPVSLRFFGAEPTEAGVILAWETEAGSNPASFSLERAPDGVAFETLASPTENNFLDTRPLPGKNFYRLRIKDLDGMETVSGVVEVDASLARDNALHFIHMTDGSVQLACLSAVEQEGQLEVWDLNGRKLLSERVSLKQGWNSHALQGIGPGQGVMVAHLVGNQQSWMGRGLKLD